MGEEVFVQMVQGRSDILVIIVCVLFLVAYIVKRLTGKGLWEKVAAQTKWYDTMRGRHEPGGSLDQCIGEADQRGRAAHKRLDVINQQLERLDDDVNDLKAEVRIIQAGRGN